MTHDLKLNAMFYEDVLSGAKPFEVRFNDRGFEVGDVLRLRERTGMDYTGRVLIASVSYVLDAPEYLQPGYVVLGLLDIHEVSK